MASLGGGAALTLRPPSTSPAAAMLRSACTAASAAASSPSATSRVQLRSRSALVTVTAPAAPGSSLEPSLEPLAALASTSRHTSMASSPPLTPPPRSASGPALNSIWSSLSAPGSDEPSEALKTSLRSSTPPPPFAARVSAASCSAAGDAGEKRPPRPPRAWRRGHRLPPLRRALNFLLRRSSFT